MKIAIARNGDDIICVKEYADIKDKGEISHFIAELELIKKELLELWDEFNDYDEVVRQE